MRNYYVQIHQYLQKLIQNVIILDKRGIRNNGDNLSITELFILKVLGDEKEKRIFEIINELSIDRNSLVTIINRLQNLDYISKIKDEEDKRVHLLKLTVKGKSVFDQISEKEKELIFSLLNDFTFNEEKAILKFLVKLDMLKNTLIE